MKKNDFAEIKKLEIKAVKEKIAAAQKEVVGLVIDKNMSKLTNLRAIKNKRRDIAQMMTVLKQKDLLIKLEGKEKNGQK